MEHFYLGIHNVADTWRFERAMISINRIKERKSLFKVNHWLLDSGAFTTIFKYGHYPEEPEVYAQQIKRWGCCGQLDAVVSQDWMCEDFILDRTGLTVADHQRLTIERYDKLTKLVHSPEIMPVLQGYRPSEYVDHIDER